MERERGTLFRRHHESSPVSYVMHSTGFGDRPAYFELHDLSESLDSDEIVSLTTKDGRQYTCQVLDRTNICAVIAM